MGLNWSDILYPDNPTRREEVNKLAQSIRMSVTEIHSNVRSVSISLNQAYAKFQVLPLIDTSLTFQDVFNNIQAVLAQWKRVTEELAMDPSIPQSIKQLMSRFEEAISVGEFPHIVKDIMQDPLLAQQIAEPVVGLIVGSIATYFITKQLTAAISDTLEVASGAGLLGAAIGAAAALLAGLIIGAIQGNQERENLESLKSKYEAMDRNLRNHLTSLEIGVAAVQRAIIKALPEQEDV